MADTEKLICNKCNKELEPIKTNFSYLGHSFFTDLPKCPKCGMVYISEEFVKSRISEVEMQLEDK
ncbi:MAG TPA: YgiT-type zinc finger protein [Perlabentimonas sp.]|jgi:YgiT-type zinc finger domain-containing protein|nr:YgiT-type zinc finger protein [Bacteroidales bacterium]MDD4671523.1 YgiT-type zinc finger protein [Bacteroidales bacterium]MDY0348263.1 YgiT-type zinc finger protein [Tenuifilaceae bacterium]HZJ74539.1 YgiT-type zinc finger protein [Perlabentimonas sp.]